MGRLRSYYVWGFHVVSAGRIAPRSPDVWSVGVGLLHELLFCLAYFSVVVVYIMLATFGSNCGGEREFTCGCLE